MRWTEDTSRNLLIGVIFFAILGLFLFAGRLTPPIRMYGPTTGHDGSVVAPILQGDAARRGAGFLGANES